MKVESFVIKDNTLIISFDVAFRQITYIKMESEDTFNYCDLECEQMEIKYSKKKNTLNLFIDDVTTKCVIFFTKFDTRDTCFSYFIDVSKYKKQNANNSRRESSNMDLMERGFKKLMNGDIKLIQDTNNNDTIVCPIKNQNIFAKVVRKV
jgi:hypothetical protein